MCNEPDPVAAGDVRPGAYACTDVKVNPVREYLRQTDGRKNRMRSRISVICRVTGYSDCTLSTHNVLLFNVLCRFFEPV